MNGRPYNVTAEPGDAGFIAGTDCRVKLILSRKRRLILQRDDVAFVGRL